MAVATGHVMRCLALAQAWQDTGGHAIFAMAESTPAIEGRLGWEGIDVIRLAVLAGSAADAASVADLALRCDAAWVVVDGQPQKIAHFSQSNFLRDFVTPFVVFFRRRS